LTALQPPPPRRLPLFCRRQLFAEAHADACIFCHHRSPHFRLEDRCEVLLKNFAKFFKQNRPLQQISRTGEHRFQLRDMPVRAAHCAALLPRTKSIDRRRVFRLRDLLRQIVNSLWLRHAYRQMKNLLGHFVEAVQARAAARENKTRGNLFQQTERWSRRESVQRVPARAFDNFREHPRENRPRRPVANAGDFDRRISCKNAAAAQP